MFRSCRVCSVYVAPRKEYSPNFCEACQKFFRRHVQIWNQLVCKSGTFDCNVENSRRCCNKCRFQKCLKQGMKSKFLKGRLINVATVRETSEHITSITNSCIPMGKRHLSTQVATISPNMEMFHQNLSAAERFLKASITAYTELVGIDQVCLFQDDEIK